METAGLDLPAMVRGLRGRADGGDVLGRHLRHGQRYRAIRGQNRDAQPLRWPIRAAHSVKGRSLGSASVVGLPASGDGRMVMAKPGGNNDNDDHRRPAQEHLLAGDRGTHDDAAKDRVPCYACLLPLGAAKPRFGHFGSRSGTWRAITMHSEGAWGEHEGERGRQQQLREIFFPIFFL